jgi:acylphosphatase
MIKEVLVTVYGNVQGVFFRQFALNKAKELGIVGYAKNLPEGTVEVVAQGEEEKLKEFMNSISAGPEEAQVESVDVLWGKPTEDFKTFEAF